jgi:hypothetical protein
MHKSITTSVLGILIVPTTLFLRTPTASIDVDATSRIWVKGTSSVRAWECQAPVFVTHVVAAGEDAIARVLAGEKAVDSASVSVVSAAMDCHNGQMTGHMKKALKTTEFDSITFSVKDYALTVGDSGTTVTLDGALTLGGVSKDISITALAKVGPEGTIQLTGKHELNMRDYDLKPPTLMFGRIKVHDKVTVGFDLLLKN